MNPVIVTIRKFGSTFYVRVPPEILDQYDLKEGDVVGLQLSAISTEPLTLPDQERGG